MLRGQEIATRLTRINAAIIKSLLGGWHLRLKRPQGGLPRPVSYEAYLPSLLNAIPLPPIMPKRWSASAFCSGLRAA